MCRSERVLGHVSLGAKTRPGLPKSHPVSLLGRENTPQSAEIAPERRAESSAFDDVVHGRHHRWVQPHPEFAQDRHKHRAKSIEVGL
ncbi:MAG: hypothetical protein QOJ66_3689 [Ilumatobacteraceae bacterium]